MTMHWLAWDWLEKLFHFLAQGLSSEGKSSHQSWLGSLAEKLYAVMMYAPRDRDIELQSSDFESLLSAHTFLLRIGRIPYGLPRASAIQWVETLMGKVMAHWLSYLTDKFSRLRAWFMQAVVETISPEVLLLPST